MDIIASVGEERKAFALFAAPNPQKKFATRGHLLMATLTLPTTLVYGRGGLSQSCLETSGRMMQPTWES
jgi:hypothetical protein